MYLIICSQKKNHRMWAWFIVIKNSTKLQTCMEYKWKKIFVNIKNNSSSCHPLEAAS